VQPVTLVRPPFVVELYEAIETALHRVAAGEVPATKLDSPVFVQDRALEPFDEAVGPRVARPCPRVRNTEVAAGIGERRFELRAAVGEDTPHRSAGRSARGSRGRSAPWPRRRTPAAGRPLRNEQAALQAVICHTLPTPLSLPM
jgi:hypothetical protein